MKLTAGNVKKLFIGAVFLVALIVYAVNVLSGGSGGTPSAVSSPAVTAESSEVTEPVQEDVAPVDSDIASKLYSLAVADAAGVNYERGEWNHWVDFTPCWSVREEVLYRDAVKDEALTLLDKNKVRTSDKANACYIVGGTWNDPYTGEVFTNPEDLDIDHMIPLNYAAQHGGQAWDSGKKESYANNLDYAHHLIAVSASANRSKSDKGPSEWKPSNTAYYCTYATDWVNISHTWGLSVTQSDKNVLNEMLVTCG